MQTAIEALPGVQTVSMTRTALLSGSTSTTGIYRQGATNEKDAKDIYIMSVSPKFFEDDEDSDPARPRTSTRATSPSRPRRR